MATFDTAETLHRLVKHAIDSGAAATLEEAKAMFQGYRLHIELPPEAGADPVNQATLLTAVALGRRVFLGGVTVDGAVDVPLAILHHLGETVGEAIVSLGGTVNGAIGGEATVLIGAGPVGRREGFCIRTAAAGWRGGILPAHSPLAPAAGPAMPLAGMLAAALAVNEAYFFMNGNAPVAGKRALGMSLWRPGTDADWVLADATEPALAYLPSQLWLIGLGHLGQAYCWALSLLPYAKPGDLRLVLQDMDIISPSTESTSILSDTKLIGQRKTRAVASWVERRGFETALVERYFDDGFQRRPDEPAVALCGLDNAVGRRALDRVGFDMVIEAGLGRGYRDFRTMRLHVLPGSRPAAEIWKSGGKGEAVEGRPAYAKLLKDGVVDQCGMTLLAGKAVGAPFVGAIAACLAVSEILRLLHGGRIHQVLDVDLLGLEQRLIVPHFQNFSALNPGFTAAFGG